VTVQFINPEGLPAPATYTQVAVATGNTMVFIAGQEPEDAQGRLDTVVGVETLAQPEYLIEVDAVAVIG
jgi:enamine deaminase RidA (YjgF/YER057c/UK114 family)